MSNSLTKLRQEAVYALNNSPDIWALYGATAQYFSDVDLSGSGWSASNVTKSVGILDSSGNAYSVALDDNTNLATGYITSGVTLATAGFLSWQIEVAPNTSTWCSLALDGLLGPTYLVHFNLAGAGSSAVQTDPGPSYSPVRGISAMTGSWYKIYVAMTLPAGAYIMRLYPASVTGPGAFDPTLTTGIYAARPISSSSAPVDYVATNTWKTPAHVFAADSGFIGARNFGRLPFYEVWTRNAKFNQDNRDGGTLTTELVVRTHVGGSSDIDTLHGRLNDYVMCAVKTIKNMTDSTNGASNYAYDGDVEVLDIENGAWGWYRDAIFRIGNTFGNSDYEYAT